MKYFQSDLVEFLNSACVILPGKYEEVYADRSGSNVDVQNDMVTCVAFKFKVKGCSEGT